MTVKVLGITARRHGIRFNTMIHACQIVHRITGSKCPAQSRELNNGMIGVFGLTDVPGTEPALLRTSKLAIQSRTQKDLRPTSLTGHPSIGHDPINWAAYRRYSDPTIEHAVSKLGRSVSFGAELPKDTMKFFAYA